jgi:hypothetical protein
MDQGGRLSSPIALMRMLGVSCFLLLVGVIARRLVVCHADATRSDPSTVWLSTLLGEPTGSGGVQGPGPADNFQSGEYSRSERGRVLHPRLGDDGVECAWLPSGLAAKLLGETTGGHGGSHAELGTALIRRRTSARLVTSRDTFESRSVRHRQYACAQ